MSDGEHFAWHLILLAVAFIAGALLERSSHKRHVMPQPRRMIK